MADVTLTGIREFFGYQDAKEFRADWMALSKEDREQIKKGFADGTLTY